MAKEQNDKELADKIDHIRRNLGLDLGDFVMGLYAPEYEYSWEIRDVSKLAQENHPAQGLLIKLFYDPKKRDEVHILKLFWNHNVIPDNMIKEAQTVGGVLCYDEKIYQKFATPFFNEFVSNWRNHDLDFMIMKYPREFKIESDNT